MLSLLQRIAVGFALAALASAQSTSEFAAAYKALASKDYDTAITHFRTGLSEQPNNTSARKDLAYTLLKTGENAAARDEFKAVLKLNPNDKQATLEFTSLSPIRAMSEAIGAPNDPRIHGTSLWAFFDSAYRSRADIDYLADHWQASGISLLFVAAWHNLEPDPTADQYLTHLINACHQHGIVVYAWLELPLVSEKFWTDHPAWREKNGLGNDAQIGWRKLMNLQHPECSRAAQALVTNLLHRFNWDGINLAELSFEGANTSDPAHFTPLNDNVRSEFQQIGGFDPLALFAPGSAHANAKDLSTFAQFRSVLESRLQSEWLKCLQASHLDIVLTNSTRIETPERKQIGVDLSAIDLSPSKLAEAISAAANNCLHVALYSENAIGFAALERLAAIAVNAGLKQNTPDTLEVNALADAAIEWSGPAALDSQVWPLRNGKYVLAPAGHHTISRTSTPPTFTITVFNAAIQSATASQRELDVAYQSRSRAPVTFDENVEKIEVDGAPFWNAPLNAQPGFAMLPAGQHLATFTAR